MGTYSNMARGIYLTDSMAVDQTKVKNIDFIVAFGGYENIYAKKYADWCQLAFNLDIPIIIRYAFSGDGGYEMNLGDPNKGFSDPSTDLQFSALRRNLTNHLTHAIMIDMSDNTVNNGVNPKAIIPEGNYANLIQWVYDNVWTQFKKPVYTFMSQAVIDNSYGGDCPKLTQITSADIGMCSYKSSQLGAATTIISWDSLPVPPDSYKPQYILNNGQIYFYQISNSAFQLPGITGTGGGLANVPIWYYHHDKATLYKDLGYVPRGTSPVVVPDPIVTPDPIVNTNVDLTDVNLKMFQLETALNALKTSIANIK